VTDHDVSAKDALPGGEYNPAGCRKEGNFAMRVLPMRVLPIALTFLTVAAFASTCMADDPPNPDDSRGRVRGPDFAGADGWLNTDKPVSIKDLKGQVVLIDFWTYCCINCMHVFPDLKFLEEKYKDKPVVVIGVHSGKFDQEKDAEHIRNAVLRHNISHPVAVDSEYAIWNQYGVRSWPSLMLIDPEGYVVGGLSGEGHRETLDTAIGKLLEIHGKKGTLGKPLTFKTERQKFQSGTLEFPGKVLADAKGKRLFIADTNHHRVLVADLDGKVSEIIGAGGIGLKDGSYNEAQFHQPQGMALSEDGATLYVADTENHAVRTVDLAKRSVTTLAGTGEQARQFRANGPGKATALSSPWDLARVGNKLFVAMAGTHQVWQIDVPNGHTATFAGTGRESAIDGPRERSTLAQPSGLATDGKSLYVADSESSTIRVIGLDENGQVGSVAGSNNLFGFGRIDGVAGAARFQHPLGVALGEGDRAGTLFVADTFNHLIRSIDLKTRQVDTWLGTGSSEVGEPAPGKIGFYEPGGLSVSGDTLYVADTNHHRIVAVDITTKKARVLDVRLRT
jgi:sugar lactone lactonase YvrE